MSITTLLFLSSLLFSSLDISLDPFQSIQSLIARNNLKAQDGRQQQDRGA
jgi:hypothetical protein